MKGPERVQAALEAAGLGVEVLQLEESARTARLAADAIGAELGSIVKSLVFVADGVPVLVLVAGDRRADLAKLRTVIGAERLEMAGAECVKRETGYSIGGVPPLGHQAPLPTWIDGSLGRFETVYAAAGHPRAVFPISFEALVRITNGCLCDVT